MATDNTNSNPWLGLRTYTEGEVIYGRSEEIIALSGLVLRNTQTVVYGRSGIGKSSILNAGVFPIARRHGVLPVYIRLEHNAQASYLEQIKAAVNREFDKLVSAGKATVAELESAGEDETLWEYFHRMDFRTADGQVIKPLVVFDQFEEIFTLEGSREKRDRFFRELADLINNVMPEGLAEKPETQAAQEEQNTEGGMLDLGLGFLSDSGSRYKSTSDFHLIFTLREDFLSYLERNTTDIPELKNNRYCLQPINEEQAAEIIMQPRKGLVSKDVARLIISHVTGEDDFLLDGIPEIQVDSAILSLYLSRLYDKMTADGQNVINAELVEAYSDNIIEDFYTDAIRGLGRESVEWMEDTLVNEDGRRDNRDRLTVMREGKLTDAELKRLTDSVKLLRQFSYGGDLRVEYIHDVLCPVIVKRRNKRQEEQRIAELSEAALREKRRARKNVLIVSMIAVGVAAAAIGAYLWNQYQYVWEVEEAYPHYETRYGWPVGIGPQLSKEEMSRTPRYYVLSKKGHKAANFTTVTVAGSNAVNTEEPAATPFELTGKIDDFIASDPQFSHIDSLMIKVGRIDFVPSVTGEIDYLAFFDQSSNPLFSAKRYIGSEGESYSFTTPEGTSQLISKYGADRLRISRDSVGFINSVTYENAEGVKLKNSSDVYGYSRTVNPDNGSVTRTMLDAFGEELAGKVSVQTRYSGGIASEIAYVGDSSVRGPHSIVKRANSEGGVKYLGKDGEVLFEEEYVRDSKGNIIEKRLAHSTAQTRLFPAKESFAYDKSGRLTNNTEYDENGIVLRIIDKAYDGEGELVYYERKKPISANLWETEALYRKSVGDGVVKTELMPKGQEYKVRIDSMLVDGTHIISEGNAPGAVNRMQVVRQRKDGILETEYYVSDNSELRPRNGEEGFFRIEETFDNMGHQLTARTFDEDGKVLSSMMYFYQNGRLSGRAAMGVDGTPVRCPDWEIEGFGYYKMYFNTDNNGEYTHIQTVNEAGVPCTLYWNEIDDYLSISYQNLKDCVVELDDNPSMPPLNSTAFITRDYSQFVALKAYDISDRTMNFLHLLDKENVLYRKGLRDGDIIETALPLTGAKEISYLRRDGNRLIRHNVVMDAALTDNDIKHIHIHPLRFGFWENRYFNDQLRSK